MIRHIVFFSARNREDLPRIKAGLETLGAIRHHDHFEVVENARVDPMGNAVDLVVYAEFRDRTALDAYKADPIYDASTQAVRPLREIRYSADYEIPDRT
ncbi:Dabb family protein [Aureimonas sp. AU12]|uniref:Dabb family protein n=1 Tax=Aureimonas sp. AU12 TaxID=1638161 RepID=UPI0007867AB8|nr:Dabb family protein [Aureimonas sp. AU12]